MTVETDKTREQFEGNNVATSFPFAFPFLDKDHIKVFRRTGNGQETQLSEGADYSLTAPGSSGTVTYPVSGSPLAVGESLTVIRQVPLDQTTAYQNQGAFYPKNHEDSFDKLTMIAQQVTGNTDGAIRIPVTQVETTNQVLPQPGDRALKILGFTGDGSVTVSGTTTLAMLDEMSLNGVVGVVTCDDFSDQFDGARTNFDLLKGGENITALLGQTSTAYLVTLNGLVQPESKYEVQASAGRIVFTSAPQVGEVATVRVIGMRDVSGGGGGGAGYDPDLVLQVSSGTVVPSDPKDGDVFFDLALKQVGFFSIATGWTWYPLDPPPVQVGVSAGNTADRPSNPEEGYVHFNNETGVIEIYEGGAWTVYSYGISGNNSGVLVVASNGNLPVSATEGDLAWVTNESKLYVFQSTNTWTSDFATASLGPNSISASMIVSGAIGTDKLAAGSVVADKIASNTITGEKIAAASISGNEIAAGAITANKIAANTITGTQIAANTITGTQLAVASINANRIQTETLIVGTSNIASGATSQAQTVSSGYRTINGDNTFNLVSTLTMYCTPGAYRVITINAQPTDESSYNVPNTQSNQWDSIYDLRINGSSVSRSNTSAQPVSTTANILVFHDTTSRSGNQTFQFYAQFNDYAGTRTKTGLRNTTMTVVEYKR